MWTAVYVAEGYEKTKEIESALIREEIGRAHV